MKKARLSLIAAFFLILFPHLNLSYARQEDLNRAHQLNQAVVQLYQQGRYAEALPLAQRALALREKALGAEHPDVAISLNNLAGLCQSLGDDTKAEPLYQRALAIEEKAFGPEHPAVVESLNNLTVLYLYRGDHARAQPLCRRALAIQEKALGPDHPVVATSLNNLAENLKAAGKNALAEPLYRRALTIREKALGPDHPDVAKSLNNLAELYRAAGDYDRAEPMYQRSLAIGEKALGPDHPEVVAGISNLASLYQDKGDYTRAEPLFQRSLAIKEKALGPEHPDVAVCISNLASLYQGKGDYTRAEPLFQRSLAIKEKAFGPEHPALATTLNNLAALYFHLGDYVKAESLCRRSLEIKEKTLGPEHIEVAASLSNLAELFKSRRDYAWVTAAEPLYQRALAIQEKAFGPEHPAVATSLHNLAHLYQLLSDDARAEPLYQRALSIKQKILGPEHPAVATSLGNLAKIHFNKGDYSGAESLYQRALAIREKVFGPEHPDVARSLYNLACFYTARDDFSKAFPLFIRGQNIDDNLIDRIIGVGSEERQIQFLSTKKADLECALNLVADYLSADPFARKQALDMWLSRKGVVLEAQRRFQEALVHSHDPAVMGMFQELAKIRSQLSQLSFAGPGKEGPEAYRQKMAELEAQKKDLEAKLSRLSQAFALQKKIEKADGAKVAQALPQNTVLLDFVRINTFNFKAKGHEKKWLPARYLAFVLPAGRGDKVDLIDLGDAEAIDSAIVRFKKDLAGPANQQALKGIETARQLHNLVFAPLKAALGGIKEVLVSPDGNLNLIPFEVLQGPDGRFLIEQYTFNYLAAGRDIIGFGQVPAKGGKALLIGDPDFDLGSEEKGAALRKLALAGDGSQETSARSAQMRGFSFQRLPGTREEIERLKGLIGEGAEQYTGKEALEEVLRQKGTPCLLHLATHGFFLEDSDLSSLRDQDFTRGIQQVNAPAALLKGVKVENPLLRSGIALAGANQTLQAEQTEKSDGLVTAEKILGLNLRGTDLVVLSACETGLGEVKAGEGVYGLRRAFVQAGTRGLVMSLWSVPDAETKELMIGFYQNMLSGKMNRVQALRQAALTQMVTVKNRYGAANPFYWGAFVYLGEP